MSNLIDTTGLKFFDAPLKTVPDNILRELNSNIVSNSGVGFGAFNPYLYNKTCLIDCSLDVQALTGGAYLNMNDSGAYAVEIGKMNVIGSTYATFEHIGNNPAYRKTFQNPNIEDYAIYVEVAPLSSFYRSYYDNVEIIGTGYKQVQNSKDYPYTTPFDIMGNLSVGTVSKESDVMPTPTQDYNDWLCITKFVVYNRAEGITSARIPLTTQPSETTNILPCILYNCQTLYYYRYENGRPKLEVFNNNFQGLIIANLMSTNSPLWQLYNWCFINVMKPDIDVNGFLSYNSQLYHQSTLGDNIKILMPYVENNSYFDLSKWISVGKFGDPKFIYRYNIGGLTSLLAFKTIDDIKWLLSDWGFTKVSEDLEVVQNMPSELFPSFTPDENSFIPSGDTSTGYNDNSTIINIPSYPDNTSDIINITTPNISSINAASVYALSIIGVKTLLNWLMTENFTKNISELFSDKLAAIDDLKLLPIDFAIHDPSHIQSSTSLTLANVTNDSLSCYKLLPNYNCVINGGNYHYTAYWGNYNDYTATSYYLYIPYGGIIELSPSHVVNCDLKIEYALDIMTGNATAIIFSNGVFVKSVPCQMGQTIPITYTNTNQREIRNTLTALNAGTSIINMAAGKTDILSGVLGVVNSAATTAMTNPLKIGSIGNFSSGTSLIMPQNPFLIISRIQQAIPAKRQEVIGIPSNINTKISSFVGSGYVQINAAHISTSATTEEQNQIINLLRNGIFI